MIENVKKFAEIMHKGAYRKGKDGTPDMSIPYIVHPEAVYNILRSLGVYDDTLLKSAWLHDVIEDTSATFEIIKDKFGIDVANLINEVSSDDEIKEKKKYLLAKMLKMSDEALTLKLADRLDNVKCSLLCSPEFISKYHNETFYIMDRLKRNLNGVHLKLISSIYDVLH